MYNLLEKLVTIISFYDYLVKIQQVRFTLGIEDMEMFGELKMLLPKPLEKKYISKVICTKLTKIWANW
jgi:hypothetical protein